MNESILLKRLEMYAMVMAIEDDLIICFHNYLSEGDIPINLIQKSNMENSNYEMILRGLDLQSYIEIINANLIKLNVQLKEKDFINNHFTKIIPIRNKVMHPRPLEFYDYPILKECFNSIDTEILFMKWDNVFSTRKLIQETPDKLFELKYQLKKSNRIIENLPSYADYEETSFIGRSRETGEIKQKLYKKNVHILSIIGDGGVGKTALAIKLLYDILDDEKPMFELIIWTSLKTTELNNYEFKQIENAVENTAIMYERLDDFVGVEKGVSTQEYIINLSKSFKTLFVLDNLETINTNDIRNFLDALSENAKILITSRIGLGEMEHRYPLDGLNENDLLEYFDALLKLYGFEGLLSTREKLNIAENHLYSNPLSIKWFVRGLYNGLSIEKILANKNDVINFCMSNVYNKLSPLASSIITVIKISNSDMTYAELMYYLDKSLDDDITIRKAINELIKCNFLNYEKFSNNFILSITDIAKEFLKLNKLEDTKILGQFKDKQKRIHIFAQDMLVKENVNPYSMYAFAFLNNDISRIIAAYYLHDALGYSRRKEFDIAFNLIDFAKKLAPRYFECNKIAASLYAITNPLKAAEEYELSLSYCETDKETATVLVLYAEVLLKMNDYQGALKQLTRADTIDENNVYIKLEKTKVLSCTGRFADAEITLCQIVYEDLETNKEKNIYLTRKADILKRRSEVFEQRDYEKKFGLIKEAFSELEKSERPDKELYNYMTTLLYNLCYMYFDIEVMEFLYCKLEK